MSYLFPIGSTATNGVLEVGQNINVTTDGVISIEQSVSTLSNVTFAGITVNNFTATTVSATNVFDNGNRVLTSFTATAGVGLIATSVVTGPSGSFTFSNNGVLSLIAGTGISISTSTGNVTVSATGASIVNTRGTGTNYTLTASDDYVGATTSSITLTLPAGITGTSYILKNEVASGGVANSITVAATNPNTIDGSTTKSLSPNASITVVFRAGQWRVI